MMNYNFATIEFAIMYLKALCKREHFYFAAKPIVIPAEKNDDFCQDFSKLLNTSQHICKKSNVNARHDVEVMKLTLKRFKTCMRKLC